MRTRSRRPLAFVLSFVCVSFGAATGSFAAARAKGANTGSLRVEILPGVGEKIVDPLLAERIPVVVFGSKAVDVREIDPASLTLAGASATKNDDGTGAVYRDVDGDGVVDMTVRFSSRQMKLGVNSVRAVLSGRTLGGRAVFGSAAVQSIEGVRQARRLAACFDPAQEKLPPLPVRIDVLPGDAGNRIEQGNRGTVPVVVFSGPGFDATKLEPAAVTLAGAAVTRFRGGGLASMEDVDGDGLADLTVEVSNARLRLAPGTGPVVLSAFTREGRLVRGSDTVSVAETSTLTFDSDDPKAGPEPPSVSFANGAAIAINDATTATPYPSSVAVAGLTGVISKVRVTLRGVFHSFPNDIDILLVGPSGQNIILMSDVGGPGPGVAGVNLTFDDDAATSLDNGSNPPTGSYRPSNFVAGDPFPAPAPAPMPATTLAAFNGTDPNGTWSLYVLDDASGDTGTILNGWQIDFVMAKEFCSGVPITIFDNSPAGPYPASVAVSGMTGVISKVTASIKGLSHTFPQDIDALLMSPPGVPVMLMSDTAGTSSLASGDLTFDDNAALVLDPIVVPANGTYKPQDNVPGDALPAPSPPPPYQPNLGIYQGTDPNGIWSLYVADDAVGDVGSIARFCVAITTITPIDQTNLTPLTIPSGAPGTTMGPANPYPVTIQVSGALGVLKDATVTLHGLTHTFPQDLDILLTAPGGGTVMLMSDVGGGGPGVSGVDYTFVDNAPAMSTGFDPPGTYRPTNDDSIGPDTMPGPAPAGPYGTAFSSLAIASPNGFWNLYVADDANLDSGSLSGGWTLTVRTYLPPVGGCNVTPLTIPAGAPGVTTGPANVYPSGAVQVGIPVDLDQYKVVVNIFGLTHTYPRDLDVLLVGPQGQKVLLLSDAGGVGPGVSGIAMTFDDDATAGVPQFTNPATGFYKPTDFEPGDLLPAPAPAGPYATSLSAFKGTNPLGAWALYVFDDATGDSGSLSGWCLNFLPSITAGEVPNLRFSDKTTLVWDAGANATSYNVYRGDQSAVASLADQTSDACRRGTSLTQQLTAVSEVPAVGTYQWYLVLGANAQGEGPPGFLQMGALRIARLVNSTGTCP